MEVRLLIRQHPSTQLAQCHCSLPASCLVLGNQVNPDLDYGKLHGSLCRRKGMQELAQTSLY